MKIDHQQILQSLRRRLRWPWIGGAAVLLFILVVIFAPDRVEVDAGEVRTGLMEVTVAEDGVTRVRDVYTVAAPLSGKLERITLDEGDPVEDGGLLAAIRPVPSSLLDPRTREEAEARVKGAEAALLRARMQVETAEAEVIKLERYVERDRRRVKQGSIAEPVLKDTMHSHFVAQGNREAARAAQDVAEHDLEAAVAVLKSSRGQGDEGDSFSICSPIDGVVLAVHGDSERVVTPGEALLDVGDPRILEIRSDILSQDAVKVRPGQRVVIDHWGGGIPLKGLVRRVDPAAFTKISALGVDEQRVWVTIDLAPDSPEPETGSPLGHGYRVEVRIVVWEKPDALMVPAGAIFRSTGGGWVAYRINRQERAEAVELEIGQRNAEVAEVLSGLEAGDRVVLHPGERVEPGTRMRVRP